jgi:PAS domain S-box-containing protein
MALVVSIGILVGVGVLGDATIRGVLGTTRLVDHARVTMAALDGLEAALSNTAVQRRNFTLTEDETFARAALESASRARAFTRELRALTADNPGQQRRLDEIDTIFNGGTQRLAAALDTIRESGFDLAREALAVREGQARLTRMSEVRAMMMQEELRLLELRRSATWRNIAIARVVAVSGAAVSFALLWLAWRHLRAQVRLRIRSEHKARANARRLATTLESIGDGVITTDPEGRIQQMNPVAASLTGFSAEEAIGRPFGSVFRIVNEVTREPAVDPVARVLSEGVVVGLSNHTALLDKDGTERSIADSAAPIRDGNGGLMGVVLVFRDMSNERIAERKLAEALHFLDSLVEHAPMMLFVKDASELRFRRFNRAGERLLGRARTDLLGKNDFDLFPAEQARQFQARDREVLSSGVLLDIPEEPIDTPTGQRWLHTQKIPILDAQGQPHFLMGISEDITEKRERAARLQDEHLELERRVAHRTLELTTANQALQREMAERIQAEAALLRTEEQLRQSQKMESLGRLAGGIAHDFNNLLSVILGYIDLWEHAPPGMVPAADEIAEVGVAGRRAADLTRQLLAFSRQQVLEPLRIDLNEHVGNLEKMLRRLIGEDIDLRFEADPRLARVKVDPGQVEQVILNLVVNARDAMPKGGHLTIETANVELDEDYAREHVGVTPGAFVMLAVSDTGTGMDASTRARIFEPFFTTKARGKGTGLGLSTVLGIVQQSEGSVWVYSEPGRGTTIKIYLPVDPDPSEISRVRLAPRVKPGMTRGSETILLVEDETAVRQVARAILQRSGYEVIEASNGAEALEHCRRSDRGIDLLLTDVIMPAMGGRELVEKALALRPNLRVLFMSGYTDDTVVRHGVLQAGVAFLQKPITPERLASKVREVLDLQGDTFDPNEATEETAVPVDPHGDDPPLSDRGQT